ncbi:HPF/RaiA family ribosome-associated protein [Candidatus Woesearchaeota archaeon]|nr:HPF/RaiA family ribosome-associated protein [Candidatus Woesearchaeota archaeon]
MEPIQITGIGELKEEDKAIVNKLANEYYEKIKVLLKNEISVKLHIKQHSKTGKRHKSDIRVKVTSPGRAVEAQESDWDLARTLHRVFKNIERQLEHRFKG